MARFLAAILLLLLPRAASPAAGPPDLPLPFHSGFETDAAGCSAAPGARAARIASGERGIASAQGSWHLEGPPSAVDCTWRREGAATVGDGFATRLDLYLPEAGQGGTRLAYALELERTDASGEVKAETAGVLVLERAADRPTGWIASVAEACGAGPAPGGERVELDLAPGWITLRQELRFEDGAPRVELQVLDPGGEVLAGLAASREIDAAGLVRAAVRSRFCDTDLPSLAVDGAGFSPRLPRLRLDPRREKERLYHALAALATAGHETAGRAAWSATDYLQEALDSALWFDDRRLKPVAGYRLIGADQQALDALTSAILEELPKPYETYFLDALIRLVTTDQDLVRAEIDVSRAVLVERGCGAADARPECRKGAKDLGEAEERLAAAAQAIERAELDSAMGHLLKSWAFAQKVRETAVPSELDVVAAVDQARREVADQGCGEAGGPDCKRSLKEISSADREVEKARRKLSQGNEAEATKHYLNALKMSQKAVDAARGITVEASKTPH